jgi:Flp pilus assembly protein TadG
MTRLRPFIGSLAARQDGVAAIEFCLTLPIMLALTFGVYDVSRMISARIDFQQAVSEGAGLAIAQPPQITIAPIVAAVASAADVPASQVAVSVELRCNDVAMPTGSVTCASPDDERARFVNIAVSGTFVPTWTHFAVDRAIDMRVSRTVRVQ